MKQRNPFHKDFLLFLCAALGMLLLVFYPLFKRGTVMLSANHLVAFYQPWASSPELGWGIQLHHKPLGDDDLWIFYPQRAFTQKALTVFHQIPFWNPLSFAGNHHVGLSETAIFYPLNVLFFILPQITAWTILTILQPLAVAIGMYLFLRLVVQKPFQAAYGAGVFALSSVVMVRMVEGLSVGHTLLWLPFVLWCIEAYTQKKHIRYLVFLCIFLVCSFTAGWFQYTFYIVALGMAYAWYRGVSSRKWEVFAPFVLFPLLSLYHVVPVVSAFLESPRGLDTNRIVQYLHLASPQHLATLLFPDFWGNPATFNFFGPIPYKEALLTVGIIPLVLALVSLKDYNRSSMVKFFGTVLGMTLLLGFNNPISRAVVSLPLPVISTFIPSRIFTLSIFCFSVLAAHGASFLYDPLGRKWVLKKSIMVAATCVLLSLGIWGMYIWSVKSGDVSLVTKQLLLVHKIDHLKSQARNTVLPTGIIVALVGGLILLRKKKSSVLLFLLVILLTFGQLWYNAHKYLPFSEVSHVYPPHPLFTELSGRIGYDRFISMGTAHIATNVPLYFGLPSVEGAGSMYIQRYGELLSFVTDPQHRMDHVLRIESYVNPSTSALLTGRDPIMQRFLEISGVRYMSALDNDRDALDASISARPNYQLVWHERHWQLWEDTKTAPRTFVTGNFLIKSTAKSILGEMFTESAPQNRIVLEKNPGFLPAVDATGSAVITSYTPNTITITATVSASALVYLSDTFSNTFRATVDGKPAEILRANYAFRAVPIPAGKHVITMYYATDYWKWGTAMSLALWIVSTGVCFILVRTKKVHW